MKMNSRSLHTGALIALTAGLTLCGCATVAEKGEVTVTSSSPVMLGPCQIEGIEGEVDCGVFSNREDPDDPDSRVIEIPFIVARAIDSENRVSDPLFLFEGGPGAAISGSAKEWVDVWSTERKQRDLVLIDVRGTGGRDALKCDYAGDPDAFSTYIGQVFAPARFAECHRKLTQHYDLTQYTTIRVVDDADAIRQAIGYKKINLAGGSYGSRLVIEYMRRHEDTVRGAFLFGLTPADEDHMGNIAPSFESVLAKLAADCREDKDCNRAFPTFLDDFYALLDLLQREPIVERVENKLGRMEEVTVDSQEFVKIVRYMLYEMDSARHIPFIVDSVTHGRYGDLLFSMAYINSRLNELFADGMWASVICAEDFVQLDQQSALETARGSAFGSQRLENEIEICNHWNAAKLPATYFQPVTSDLPLLMMVGGADVATPVGAAQKHIRFFSRGRLIVVPPAGHEIMPMQNPCLESIVHQFFKDASGAQLDTDCVADITRPPFSQESPFASQD